MNREQRQAFEAEVGYALCGCNGCILPHAHPGDCVIQPEAGRRRRSGAAPADYPAKRTSAAPVAPLAKRTAAAPAAAPAIHGADATATTSLQVEAAGSSSADAAIECGQRCWLVVDRGLERGQQLRRVLVQLQQSTPAPLVRAINSKIVHTAAWTDLAPLSAADEECFLKLSPIGEPELANVIAAVHAGGCTLAELRWKRELNGAPYGARRDAVPKAVGSPKRAIRLGKMCTTPGCTFPDFHDGPCSHEHELAPRRSRAREGSRLGNTRS
jgi:hypothetical protein